MAGRASRFLVARTVVVEIALLLILYFWAKRKNRNTREWVITRRGPVRESTSNAQGSTQFEPTG
jgi:hypothetical protein